MLHNNIKAEKGNIFRVIGSITKFMVLLSLDILLAQLSAILSDRLCMLSIIYNNLELDSHGITLLLKLELLEMTQLYYVIQNTLIKSSTLSCLCPVVRKTAINRLDQDNASLRLKLDLGIESTSALSGLTAPIYRLLVSREICSKHSQPNSSITKRMLKFYMILVFMHKLFTRVSSSKRCQK